jgi:hypothetical protein
MCLVVLVGFHAGAYDLVLLTIPVLLLLESNLRSRELGPILMSPMFLLFCSPLYILAIAKVEVAMLALVVCWLWAAVAICRREQETAVLATVPDVFELVAVRR